MIYIWKLALLLLFFYMLVYKLSEIISLLYKYDSVDKTYIMSGQNVQLTNYPWMKYQVDKPSRKQNITNVGKHNYLIYISKHIYIKKIILIIIIIIIIYTLKLTNFTENILFTTASQYYVIHFRLHNSEWNNTSSYEFLIIHFSLISLETEHFPRNFFGI